MKKSTNEPFLNSNNIFLCVVGKIIYITHGPWPVNLSGQGEKRKRGRGRDKKKGVEGGWLGGWGKLRIKTGEHPFLVPQNISSQSVIIFEILNMPLMYIKEDVI